jgi:proline iminopeptidase
MKRKIFKFLFLLAMAISMTFVFLLFTPRNYDVSKTQKRENIKYWDLSTGSRIAYTLISGKGSKKPFPIVYLHGGPGGPIYNSNITSLLQLSNDGYDIYLYDQIGGGHSNRLDNIEDYTVNRHKSDLEEIVRKIGSEKIILIGQSWGATLANLFVVDNSDKVKNMILTGPGPILPIRKELSHISPPDSLKLKIPQYSNKQANEKAHNIRSIFMLKWAKIFGNKLASDKEADEFADYLNSELNKSTVSNASIKRKIESGAGFYAQIMTVKSFKEIKDHRFNMKKITIPVLVMKGQYDNQKWGYTQEYLKLYPNSKLVVIPNAGHAIYVEQPIQYIKTIREFLKL